jgi:hypothetical protein
MRMNDWTIIKALGEENLVQAIEDYEKKGWEIHTVMFAGVEMVSKKFDINSKPMPIGRYVILARKLSMIQGEA